VYEVSTYAESILNPKVLGTLGSENITKNLNELLKTKQKQNLLLLIRIIYTLNAELNPIYPLLSLFGAHHILHVSRLKVKSIYIRSSATGNNFYFTRILQGNPLEDFYRTSSKF